ncbi:hypothetical protein IFM89_020959 [Coptis chinensis]|uniref:Alpha/beta hydrolase fold-3 domain-containing protein n=1 Tax=Coptis chinensis TaxID=261450 RepID=A0A835IEB7_9MAGN|nr:hypothetical protein IFM89_020959 [Coptis chinensis]
MAEQNPFISPINPYEVLGIVYNPDDTLTRQIQIPCTKSTDDNSLAKITKDIPLNVCNKTWLRLFRPVEPPVNVKLPIILYFHGGGFILCSAFNTIFHNFCASMASKLPALIVSVGYRLAPESRLPSAYEDAIEAITWVKKQALDKDGEQWLKDLADFSKCYLMGCSSGGNIVYHAGLRAISLDLNPLLIKGLILNQPFFGGSKRTESEMRMVNDKTLPLVVCDLMWELALPAGSDRDHEYCNPRFDGGFKENINLLSRCFVSVRGGDPLMDHQKEFVKMVEGEGVKVVNWFEEAGYHGMELFEPHKAEVMFVALKDFIYFYSDIE